MGCTQKKPDIQVIPSQNLEVSEEKEDVLPEVFEPLYIKAVRQKKVAKKPLPVLSPMIVIGETEPVFIKGMSSHLEARIDTGATTSSLDAIDIKRFERDGKPWVSFTLVNETLDEKVTFEKPVNRRILVKRHGEESQRRMVVKLQIRLGGKMILREFSLINRSAFDYPILIGRNVLSGFFLVDVSRKNITSVMQEGANDN